MKITKHRFLWSVQTVGIFVIAWITNVFVIWIFSKLHENTPNLLIQLAIKLAIVFGAWGILALTIGFLLPRKRERYHPDYEINFRGNLVVSIGAGLLAPLIYVFDFIIPLFDKSQRD